MPVDEEDPLRRRQRKAASRASIQSSDDSGDLVFETQVRGHAAASPIDYSKFGQIGEDSKQERAQTGDVTWDELNTSEKKQVFEAGDRFEEWIEERRQEEDGMKQRLREKPADLSWVQGRRFASYEAFCVGRVESTFKQSGNDAYKKGDYSKAGNDWQAGVDMLLALGDPPPEALALICVLRNNLAQLYVKARNWSKVKELTDKIIFQEPTNQKALYRRAQAYCGMSLWEKAESDLELLLQHHPSNKDAIAMMESVRRQLGKERTRLAGRVLHDIAAGLQELSSDGTVRKLKIEDFGTCAGPNWQEGETLESAHDKLVVTCHMRIWTHGGEELYNSREYRPYPETKKERDALRETIDMVNFLDQEAGKAPRIIGDFYQKVKKRPVRWRVGDPGMYKGFDIAVRTMKPGERAIFEIDQPMLAASVEEYYSKAGFHSSVAGLPQLIYSIEEERLAILEDELPASELDLDNRMQRGVRVEFTCLGFTPYRDVSPNRDASVLHAVLHPGSSDAPLIKQGDEIRGSFFITRPFDGSLLVANSYCEWRLGIDEGSFARSGENKEPLRPDGGPFIPRCVGEAILAVDWVELRQGALVEVRTQIGPEILEIAPQYAQQFEKAVQENRQKGRKCGSPCSILVQALSRESPGPDGGSLQATVFAEEFALPSTDIE